MGIDAKVSWLIEDFVVEGGVTLLTGDAGVGKSTLAIAACRAVLRGEPFLGRGTTARKVLYIDRENPVSILLAVIDRLHIPEVPDLEVWGEWCPTHRTRYRIRPFSTMRENTVP